MLIDGNNAAHRFRHVHGELRTSLGEYTGVLFGFVQFIVGLSEEFSPSSIYVAWDRFPKFRKQFYSGYKSGRKERYAKMGRDERKAYDDFNEKQMPSVISMLRSWGIPQIRVKGFEADDVMAFRRMIDVKEYLLVTTDHDAIQLVNTGTRVYNPQSHSLYYFDEKQGCIMLSSQAKAGPVARGGLDYVLRKVIMGDTSDSIPGVRGIGEVKADKLLRLITNIHQESSINVFSKPLANIFRELAQRAKNCPDKVTHRAGDLLGDFPVQDLVRNFILSWLLYDDGYHAFLNLRYREEGGVVLDKETIASEMNKQIRWAKKLRKRIERRLDIHHLLHPLYFDLRRKEFETITWPDTVQRLHDVLMGITYPKAIVTP